MHTGKFSFDRAAVEELIRLAGTAPSGGNVQAWKVRAEPQRLSLSLDEKRSDSFIDVERYASIFSLGSFAATLAAASKALGYHFEHYFHGYQSVNEPLAHFDFSGRGKSAVNATELLNRITERVTNRRDQSDEVIPPHALKQLHDSISASPNLRLQGLTEHAEKTVASSILGRADRIRMHHKLLHEQMFQELRWSQSEAKISGDGIDTATLELPSPALMAMRALRHYPVARYLIPKAALEGIASAPIAASAQLCCLSTRDKLSPESLYQAGWALQDLWLAATGAGLAVHPWTVLPFLMIRAELFPDTGLSPAEEAEIRSLSAQWRQLLHLQENERPLFVFRLSRGSSKPGERSLRLPWQHLTTLALAETNEEQAPVDESKTTLAPN